MCMYCGGNCGENNAPQKFKRVSLESVLRADADGMPIFRKCFEHETLMSFYDDDGNYAFHEWWNQKGSAQFLQWIENSEEFKYLANWEKE